MILSPPFLVPRAANATDEEWLAAAMPEVNSGRFPLSSRAAWHGGVHLEAPVDSAGNRLPVSAIADGVVAYVRAPTPQVPDPTHPQNYGSSAGPVWTDNGCVVLRHETDIGVGAANAATNVIFFSVYMHLSAIDPAIQNPQPAQAQRLYRKETLGTAGQLYGQANILHFEIGCDDDNLTRIVGRPIHPTTPSSPNGGGLPFTADGRTDALFGTRYFFVPSGTAFFSRSPVEYRLALDDAQQAATANQTPPPAALPNPPAQRGTLAQDVLIALDYADGDVTVSTLEMDGTAIGGSILNQGSDYGVLTQAEEVARFVRLTNQDNNTPNGPVPAVSACLELLRFGRILHGGDALNPATTPHWRLAHLPGGQRGFIDLNQAGIFKSSDADFPQWKTWHFVDGTVNGDSRCDDATLRALLDADNDGTLTETETNPASFPAEVVTRLRRVVAKFPTEWDATGLQNRWAWLQVQASENPTPMSAADLATYTAHAQAMCFWSAQIGLPSTHWHFHPAEFLAQMRKGFWFSGFELAQCIPRQSGAGATSWRTASARGERQAVPMSGALRRYGIVTQERVIHFIAQVLLETIMLRSMSELGSGRGHAYAAFHGRGYMQLTWPQLYRDYGQYRSFPDAGAYTDARITATSSHCMDHACSRSMVWSPRYDPGIVATDLGNASDSGAFFWVSKHFRGTSNMNRSCDLGLGTNIVGFNSWLVNGGGNGYAARQEYARYLFNVLGDEPLRTGIEAVQYAPLSRALTGTFPPGNPAQTAQTNAHHTPRQRP